MDAIDRQIVEALVADARISLKNLSTRVKLSSPSVSERLRRLEERGVIRAFTVELSTARALSATSWKRSCESVPCRAKVRSCTSSSGRSPRSPSATRSRVRTASSPGWSSARSEDLDRILSRIADKAETNTSLIKSHTIRRRLPPLAAPGERPQRRRAVDGNFVGAAARVVRARLVVVGLHAWF